MRARPAAAPLPSGRVGGRGRTPGRSPKWSRPPARAPAPSRPRSRPTAGAASRSAHPARPADRSGRSCLHPAPRPRGAHHPVGMRRAQDASRKTGRVDSVDPSRQEPAATGGRRTAGRCEPAIVRGPPALIRGWRVAALALSFFLLAGSGGSAAPATKSELVPPFVAAGRLLAPDGRRAEHFGFAVALDGSTLAVGSRSAKVGSEGRQGAVYVYVRSGSAWVLQQKLTAADGAANDHFGDAVALRGDRLVAGAPYRDVDRSQDQGAVYVFQRTGTTWAQDAKIAAPGGERGERFGWALGLSGSTLAVGVPMTRV